MSKVVPIRPQDELLDQCSQWIARMDRGLSSAEEEQLKAWMAEDKQHRFAMLEMAHMWDKMDALERLSDVVPAPVKAKQSRWPIALAASVAAAAMTLFATWSFNEEAIPQAQAPLVLMQQQAQTAVGETLTLKLPDSSELMLNTNSLVSITYTDNQRVLELEQGELHIQVAHDPERPLSVYAGGQVIQAVGTAFNVQYFEGEVELLVTEGKVLVAEQGQDRADPILPKQVSLPRQSLALEQGQKSLLSAVDVAVEQLALGDIQVDLSWQQGNLVFRGEPLSEVMMEVGRYTNMSFELGSPELADVQVAGLFQTHDLDGLLSALAENFDIRHQRISPDRILLTSTL